jgi:hypothetical protein
MIEAKVMSLFLRADRSTGKLEVDLTIERRSLIKDLSSSVAPQSSSVFANFSDLTDMESPPSIFAASSI